MGLFRRKKFVPSDEPIKINDFLFEGSYIKDFTYFCKFKLLPVNEIYYKTYINTIADKVMKNIKLWEDDGLIVIDKTTNAAYLSEKGENVLKSPEFSEKIIKDTLGNFCDGHTVINSSELESITSENEKTLELLWESLEAPQTEKQSTVDERNKSVKSRKNYSDDMNEAYSAKSVTTKTEADFFDILNPVVTAYGGHVDRKVGVKDLVEAGKHDPDYIKNFNRISQKHIDFAIFEEEDVLKKYKGCPLFLIELDDPSHDSPGAKERDSFKNQLFQEVGIPLERIYVGSKEEWKVQVEQLCQNYLRRFVVNVPYVRKNEAKALMGKRALRWNEKEWYVVGKIALKKLLSSELGCTLPLKVTYEEKEAVKKLGAKWNPEKKLWYIDTADIDKFEKWID